MKKKKVLVTGGVGFLGSHLCERLLTEKCEVTAVDNFFTGTKGSGAHLMPNPSFELIGHDITTPFFANVDQIYNLACSPSHYQYQHDPVMTLKASLLGSINMLELARKTYATVIQVSSAKIYGNPEVSPITESYNGNVDPIGIDSAYEEGKRAAETVFMHTIGRIILNPYCPSF